MGTVWLAHRSDHQFEQRVAIKLIKRGMDTDDVLRRFRRERQVLAQLVHPHIARLLDGGATEDGRPYLVMELIEGVTITEHCAMNRLPLNDRLRLFIQVCAAVQYAHQSLVVHRDLKPTNVLVSSDGTPKLLDFGIAKIIRSDDDPYSTATTSSDIRLLTPRYASPEQVRNERVTTATDTYSLGVILYELLTGAEPYQLTTRSRAEYERAICEQQPLRPSAMLTASQGPARSLNTRVKRRPLPVTDRRQRERELVGDLDTITLKALQKEPAERYSSVEQFVDDLERFLAGLPVLARPQTFRYRTTKFLVRNKLAVFAGSTTAVALIIAACVSVTYGVREARQRALAEQHLREARTQASIAGAINQFLNEDLLASAAPDQVPDRQATVRSVLDAASNKIGGRFQDQPFVEASIRNTIGAAYESLGEYETAEAHYVRASELFSAFEADHESDVIEEEVRLGNLTRLRGRLDDAETRIREAYNRAQKRLGPTHPTTLNAGHFLSEVYIDQGRSPEAEGLLKRTIELKASTLGPEHAATLLSMGSLSSIYLQAGRYEEAREIDSKLLDTHMRKSGPDNPATIATLNNLAYDQMHLGNYQAAEQFLLTAVKRSRRVSGADHPATLTSLDNLGRLYTTMGRYSEAERIHTEEYRAYERTLGATHPATINARNNLGLVYLNRGQFEQAEPVYRDIVAALLQSNGPDHPSTMTAQNNLAYALMELHRLDEAEQRSVEVLDRRRRVLGEDHPDTIGAMSNLARVRTYQGRFEEAEGMFADALERASRTLPENHVTIGVLRYRQGLCLTSLAQFDAAERSLTQALSILTAALGPEHDRVIAVQKAIDQLNQARARPANAPDVAAGSSEP